MSRSRPQRARWLAHHGDERQGNGAAINLAELEATGAALSSLNRRLMEAQEQERRRLGRELHDDIGQRVALLAIGLTRLSEMLPPDAAQTRLLADALSAKASELGSAIQGISHRMHSPKLEYLGFASAVKGLCREWSAHASTTIAYVQEGMPADVRGDIALNLFRVVQEALANALKHSGAQHCTVTVRGTSQDVNVEVIDDGCGFDPRSSLSGHGLGLVSMRERACLINGEVSVESEPGRGTVVNVRVPLHRKDTEAVA